MPNSQDFKTKLAGKLEWIAKSLFRAYDMHYQHVVTPSNRLRYEWSYLYRRPNSANGCTSCTSDTTLDTGTHLDSSVHLS